MKDRTTLVTIKKIGTIVPFIHVSIHMAYDRINVRGVIRDGNKLFLVKHKEEYDYRVLPGGGMDPGEDAKSALKRELYEELGIDCTVSDVVFVHEFYASGRDYNILELILEVTPTTPLTPNIHRGTSHEHEIYASDWITVGEDKILPEWITAQSLESGSQCLHSYPLHPRG